MDSSSFFILVKPLLSISPVALSLSLICWSPDFRISSILSEVAGISTPPSSSPISESFSFNYSKESNANIYAIITYTNSSNKYFIHQT